MQFPSTPNIAEMLRLRAAVSGEAGGIVYQGIQLSWSQLFERANRIAEALTQAGIGRGDVVGILAPHSPAQAASLFGIALADAAFSIINPLLKPGQVRHQITDASMKAVIADSSLRLALEADLADLQPLRWFDIELDGILGGNEAGVASNEASNGSAGDAAPAAPSRTTANIPTDVANIIYTSGSTGRPKGVVVPHRTLLDGARIVSSYLGITDQDRTLSMLPFGFDYGLNQLMTAVYTGATVVIYPYAMPLDLLRVMQRERITGMAAVPAIWPGFLAHAKRLKEPIELPHLRYITTAGGAHPPELLRQLDDAFPGSEVIIMYGLTESFRSTYLPYSELHERPGCVGRPVPEVEILVVDDQGRPCPPGVRGELVHRGAFVTYGYLNNPELTARRFIDLVRGPGCLPEKAVRSGDLVSMSDDGFIYFHGRMDSQIKSRGYRISPDEVAEAVMKVVGVRQAAVFGLPDPNIGQRIVTAYETHSGSEILPRDFMKLLSSELPSYAVPQTYRFYAELPVTANGKLDVTRVRQECEVQEAVS